MKKLMDLIGSFSGLLLAMFFVLVALDVLARNVLKISLPWISEASTFAFIWMTLMSSVVGFIEDKHYKVSIFSEQFELKMDGILFGVEVLSVLIFAGLLVWQGINFTIVSASRTSAALGIPMNYMVCAIPLCGAGIILAMLYRVYLRKTGRNIEEQGS